MALSGLVAGDVADDRNDAVVDLHRANELKRVFVGEIADLPAGAIRLHHQSSERRIVAAIVAADARVPRVEPLGNERARDSDRSSRGRAASSGTPKRVILSLLAGASRGDRLRIDARVGERGQDLARSIGPSTMSMSAGTGFAEQRQQILEPVARHHEQRLEEQMLEHVVATNVEHERDRAGGSARCTKSSDRDRRRCRRRRERRPS